MTHLLIFAKFSAVTSSTYPDLFNVIVPLDTEGQVEAGLGEGVVAELAAVAGLVVWVIHWRRSGPVVHIYCADNLFYNFQ